LTYDSRLVAFIKFLRNKPFRWGALLALPPAVLGLPAASYAGMAVMNLLWQLMFERESPVVVYVLGGLTYGLICGLLLQCLVLGIAGYLVWNVCPGRLAGWIDGASRTIKVLLVIAIEIIIVPVSAFMTMAAYAGPAMLAWLFSLE
jgi:hypothetical protein